MNPISKIKMRPWYKWVIAAACFLMVMICLGFCSSTKPLYLSAITKALDIERSFFPSMTAAALSPQRLSICSLALSLPSSAPEG